VRVRLADVGREFVLSASLFRHEQSAHVLIRLVPVDRQHLLAEQRHGHSAIPEIIANLPDGFVVVDADRRILAANASFLEMAQLVTEDQVRGEPIDRWIGRIGVDVDVLIANLREHGAVRKFASVVRGEYGVAVEVEIAAVHVPGDDGACYGLVMRKSEPLRESNTKRNRALSRSVEQLTELVGRVPLKELVRETTDIIERLCIEAALELTSDNRASAAEILGLSRQSLYVKLRRYGLGELDTDREGMN
jgi:transcriptional regulator PpsR